MFKEGYVVECRGLSKKYKGALALNRVDLKLERGKIIGLVGPNGSGKTTLIKLLNGLLVPTEGELLINNMAPGPETKARVDVLNIEGTAAVVRVTLEDWHGLAFTDFHSLIKEDGQWKILAKVFHQYQ